MARAMLMARSASTHFRQLSLRVIRCGSRFVPRIYAWNISTIFILRFVNENPVGQAISFKHTVALDIDNASLSVVTENDSPEIDYFAYHRLISDTVCSRDLYRSNATLHSLVSVSTFDFWFPALPRECNDTLATLSSQLLPLLLLKSMFWILFAYYSSAARRTTLWQLSTPITSQPQPADPPIYIHQWSHTWVPPQVYPGIPLTKSFTHVVSPPLTTALHHRLSLF